MDHVEFDREPPANLTTLVMAFGGWSDAGQAATGTLRHLVRVLSATRLAGLAPAPHTRPVRVTARSTDPTWRSVVEAWGIYRRPTYEGPTGITTVLLDAAERRGISHLGLMGQAPHYLQNTENPAAIHALLTCMARLLHLSLDMSRFTEAIKEFRSQCDREVARNRATREHVQQLEQQYDATASEERQTLPDGELDSDKLMQELEEFLRKQREGGQTG